jgi:putative NADPH-quinone reductase
MRPISQGEFMEALIIYAHPWPGSYNHAILDAVKSGLHRANISCTVIDLNEERFDPVLAVSELAEYVDGVVKDPVLREYQRKIAAASLLFFIFPIWWGTIPAILKGFMDRVFTKDWAFTIRPSGALKGKMHFIRSATVISTMNAPGFFYKFFMGNSLRHVFIKGFLNTCGIRKVKWFNLTRVVYVPAEKRKRWLAQIEKHVSRLKLASGPQKRECS